MPPITRPVWHVNCTLGVWTERMATKMNMMRLVQEVRGFAEIIKRRPQTRSFGPLMLPLRQTQLRNGPKSRHIVRLTAAPVPDIPHAVAIRVIRPEASKPGGQI